MNRIHNFRSLNLILGWLVFTISAVVYLLTIEPSASLWDCSEFIATSYKMEVGHPPGAPLFMMLNRFFTLFASDVSKVAMMVNATSAVASALTILFLFWTISHLGRRLLNVSEQEMTTAQLWSVMGAAAVGSLAYAFTDTFWFSAVEGEVYAQSSLFTALVFWGILKWENVAGTPHANRWLVLLAYLMGLSIGVHLLNLLAIPAIVFVYYFKMNSTITKWGWIKAAGISVAILAFALYGIVPQTVAIGAWFDRIFVNGFGMPVNSGLLSFYLILLGGLGVGAYFAQKKGKVLLNTILLCCAVMVMGYGTYASVVIRASANPPMNSNDPSNPYSLLYLLNREQYGSKPLVHGQYYSTPAADIEYKTSYRLKDGKYEVFQEVKDKVYDSRFTTIFPRMWSDQSSHIKEYQRWGQVQGRNIPYGDKMVNIPTFGENMRYFFTYQVNFMYWRYFLWNFVGRQNDLQSQGEIINGNWASGITPIDELYLGPQENLPETLAKNKGRNNYYFLPFILGLIGLLYQLKKDGRNFTVVMWLFLMTGVAIIFYLNQPPLQPRERDYAYAGSFYAYSIWIGLGVMWLFDALNKRLKNQKTNAVIATVICLSVPAVLIAQNWDDHDRSNRYVARDFGANYLNSTLPGSIIFPYGDNDTFPLWYNQEVEGTRPDVRIMNISYAQSDWYLSQMRIRSNGSDPIEFSLPYEKYIGKEYTLIYPNENIKGYIPLKSVLEFIKSNDPRTQAELVSGEMADFIPTRQIAIPVNKANALKSGIVSAKDSALMVDTIYIDLQGEVLTKSQLAAFDIISTADWSRPIYFTQPMNAEELGLKDYLQLDGFAYRLVPIKTSSPDFFTVGRIDTEYLYDKMMNQFKYGNVNDTTVNVDYFTQYTFSATQARNNFGRLAQALAAEGKTDKAIAVLDHAIEQMPFSQIEYGYTSTVPLIEAYYQAGAKKKANALFDDYMKEIKSYLRYYSQFKGNKAGLISSEVQQNLFYMYQMYTIASTYGEKERAKELESYLKAVDAIE